VKFKLGILGLLLFGVITVLWKHFNNPPTPGKTLLFLLLMLVPITLLPYLFVDKFSEAREPKNSIKVLALILFLGLLSAAYDGNLNLTFFVQWVLLLGTGTGDEKTAGKTGSRLTASLKFLIVGRKSLRQFKPYKPSQRLFSMPKVELKESPSPEEIKLLVDSAFSSRGILTIFARCRVHYDGRAKSELGPGDRIIIVKPDGSFLVHRREKREPVNWQPPGSAPHLEFRDKPVLVSVRRKPRETLEVELHEVYLISVFHAEDSEELALTGSEAEMVDMVFDNPHLVEPGFKPLFKEKDIGHGIVDLLGRDSKGNLVVLEFKRRRADLHAVSQLKRYVEALSMNGSSVRGILVAPSVTSGALKLLRAEGLEFLPLKPPKHGGSSKGRQTTLF